GSFTASAGQVSFNGTSTFSGTANLFNVSLGGGNTLTMGTSAVLGIAGTVTSSGTFNPSTNVPNTVNYNGAGAQSTVFTTFNNLTLSNGNTKTPSAGLTVGGNLTIGAATTFAGGTFTHSVSGNWVNNGTFTASTSTVQFVGSTDTSLTGATTFNNLTINKGSAANVLTLANNISAANVAMTQGKMLTGSNSVTITSTRTGNGIIIGTITRTHAFTTGTNYAFEGPNNFINFSSITSGTISSITVIAAIGPVTSFPAASSANRSYNISVTATGGTTYASTVRLHYEQAEINGNAESAMTFWNDGGIGSWTDRSKNSNNVLEDWVEKTGVTDLLNTWTLSEGLIKFSWTGATSTAWGTSTNWSPNGVPSITDVVHLGDLVFTNQPVISPAAQVKKMYFDSTTPVTLTLSGGGSITVQGNIDGVWSADAVHNINLGTGSLTTFSDIVMSEGTANRRINISASTGIINVNGSLTQSGGANLTFTGGGSLNIGENYNYVSGTFTPGTSTVTYNGIADQTVADVTYYNLAFDKTSGIALVGGNTAVTNNLTTATSGAVNVTANLDIDGGVNIGAGTVMSVVGTPTINVGGDWVEDGLFVPGFGSVTFDGTGAQSLEPTLLNNMIINKPSGTLTLGGNLGINGNISVQSGTVDAVDYTVTRSVLGGSASMSAGTTIRFSGSVLQIFDFAAVSIDPASTIEYYGTNVTAIPPVTYGNLVISNGGSNAKNIVGPTTVAGDLTINSGATLATPATTLILQGSLINNGTFDSDLGSLVLEGTNETITGGFIANDLIISGSYDVLSGNIEVVDRVEVTSTGDFDAGSSTVTLHGDVTNNGNYSTDGITIFSGTQTQVIQLNNAINSSATGVVNFNGTVAPEFNSTAAPILATVNINNTAAIVPSQPWTVLVAMNIASGSTFSGGSLNHNFGGNFNNAGTFNSSGKTTFNPSGSVNVVLGNNFNNTGVVDFSGTGVLNLTDNTPTFQSVSITNTNGAGIIAGSDWVVNQNVFIGPGAELHGGSGTSHAVSGGWTNNGLYTGETSSVIFNSAAGIHEIGGTGINNFNNITFASGAQFGIVTDIVVSGNLTNDATSLSLVNGEVTFNGNALSVIGGSSVCTFGDIVVDKTAATVRMDNDVNVASTLTLTNGVLSLNANTISITNPTEDAVFRTNGYVLSEDVNMDSRFNWAINNNLSIHEFPFGSNAGDYIPFVFELSTGDAGTVSVATYSTPANNLPLPPGVNHVQDEFGADNSINTVDRFFQIDILGGTSPTANITFNMTAAEVGSITTLLGQRWNGASWDVPILGQTSGATSVTVPNVTQFSPWAVSGNSTPLPITLVDFSARQVANQIVLGWTTASEKDNDYFQIEKSYDAKKFISIGTTKGAGDSDLVKHYSFTDRELKEGIVYYRLKQVDFDGKSTMSHIVNLNVSPAGEIALQVFPNPTTDFLNISYENGLEDNLFVTMLDGSGKVVMRGEGKGTHEPLKIDVSNLHPGTYMVQVIAGRASRVFRVVKAE
ncbi:MAG: T9SS type A sorting domain-containing protein, partial [Cyclobacteriaceae bacterium]